jgi:hypothetical protein
MRAASSDTFAAFVSRGPCVRRPFPVDPVRTLDAVHLATAESIGEPPQLMTMVTRDNRVRENATALGYSVE